MQCGFIRAHLYFRHKGIRLRLKYKNLLPIRLLRLTSQNYVISHWVAYYDMKYNELNEAFTVFSNLFKNYSERATESPKSQTLLTFFKNIFVIQ